MVALRGKCLMLSLFLFCAAPSLFSGLPKEFYGDAYNAEGKLLFREKHHVYYDGDQTKKVRTDYYDPLDQLVAYLESSFLSGPYLPNTYFRRLLDGFTARCITESDNKVILMRKDPNQEYYFEKSYPKEPDMVAGHGFYFFILDNIDYLLKNQGDKPINFLLPTRLANYPCQMSAQIDPEDSNVIKVEMKLTNPLMGFFLEKIIVKFKRDTRQLISYEGPNTLLYCYQLLCHVKIKYSTEKN